MNTISVFEAYKNAVAYAHLEENAPQCVMAELENGLYELEIRTVLMHYDFYVDAVTGEVMGMDSEPETDLAEVYSYSFLRICAA